MLYYSIICFILYYISLHLNMLSVMYYNAFNNNAHTPLQLWNCVCHASYKIWVFLNRVTVLIIASFGQMRSYLHPKGNWTAFLSWWGLGVVGPAPAASEALSLFVQWLDLLSCACSGWVASPTGLSRPRVTIKSRLGGFSPLSPQGCPPALD